MNNKIVIHDCTGFKNCTVCQLIDAYADIQSKLEFALKHIPCEEGIFTFPDGDSWPAGDKAKGEKP